MLTLEMCRKRRSRLWARVPDTIEWIVLGNPKHIYYMCGFLINPVSFSAGEKVFLILERSEKAILVADDFALSSSEAEYYVDDVVEAGWYDKIHSVRNRTRSVVKALVNTLCKYPKENGCSESEWVPSGLGLEKNEEVLISDIILSLRRKKEPDEIAILKKIAKASDAGHARAFEIIRPGITEMEVYREISEAVLKSLGQPAIIYGDFRFVNAQMPLCGGTPTGYSCKPGDLFILDYSVAFLGYRTDCTNTISVGKVTEEQQKLFDLSLNAIKKTEPLLVPDRPASEVFSFMYQIFKENNHETDFGRHAGHGLGLSHPEAPCFGPESDEVLIEGDVVTLEPGIYMKGTGGVRLERNYLITGDGPELLTRHRLSL